MPIFYLPISYQRRILASAIILLLLVGVSAAQSVGKRIEFQASGGENRIDAHVLGAVRDALPHVVRNAVAHGIEPESERRGSGKDPLGRVELSVERRGNRVTFLCRDDGRGIDLDAVRKAALRKGIGPGPGTEAGSGVCYVKFGAARSGPTADREFKRLLDACEEWASSRSASRLVAGVNTARHEAYRNLFALGFRTDTQGVVMSKPNEPGYNRPGIYLVDDWR